MGNNYQVRVEAVLDVAKLRAQLQGIGKDTKIKFDTSSVKNAQNDVKKFGDTVTRTTSEGGKGARNMGREFKGLKTYISDGAKSLGSIAKQRVAFLAMTDVVSGAAQGMKAMVGSVFELDASLTEMKKVSDLNGASLDKFTKKAFDVGTATARTGTEAVNAATQFKKMGYSVDTSLNLGKLALKFQNIADTEISAGDAALFINSQMKAFNITASNAEHILDSVNQVANNFAVGTNDLSGALTVAGSALGTVGNSFEQTIGLITSATELMPGKAQTVGNSFRTIGINIAKMANSSDEWVAANGRVNVALKDSQGNLRSTYDIMKDLYTGVDGQSVAWKDLSEAEQNAIAVQAAGKTRYQAFVAAMSNFKTAINATETALHSQGSAQRENERAMDSLEGHLNQLKSAFQKFANSIMSSGFLKGIIDIGTAFLTVASTGFGQFILKAGLVAGAIGVLARGVKKLYSAVKGMSFLEGLKTLWLGTAAGATEDAAATEADTKAKERNTAATERNTAAQQRNAAARGKSAGASAAEAAADSTVVAGKDKVKTTKRVSKRASIGKAATESMLLLPSKNTAKQTEKTATGLRKLSSEASKGTSKVGKLAKSFGGLVASMGALKLGAIAGGALLVGNMIYKTYKETTKYDRELGNLKKSNNDNIKQTETQHKLAISYVRELERLNSIEHKNGAQKQLMTDYVKKLNEIYPELNLSYDENTDKLSQNTDAIRRNIEEQNDAAKQTAYQENIEKSIGKVVSFGEKAENQKFKVQELTDSLSGLEKGTDEYNKTLVEIDNHQQKYLKLIEKQAEAQIEATKWQNKLTVQTDEYKESLAAFEKAGGKVSESVERGIKKGIYSAPVTKEEWEHLVNFDTVIEKAKKKGIEIPDTLYQGIQDGTYKMPQTALDLKNLISFDKAIKQANSLGVEIPEEFIQGVQSKTPAWQKAYRDTFEKIGKIENPEDMFQVGQILNDTSLTMEQRLDKIRTDILGLDGISATADINVDAGDFDDVIQKVQKYLDELPEGEDVTISAKDDASGIIEDVTISADDYAKGKYMAEIMGRDNASSVIAYAQDVANGFEGTYEAWLLGNATPAEKAAWTASQTTKAFANGKYEARITAKNNTASGVNQARSQLKSIPASKTVTIRAVVSGIKNAAAQIAAVANAAIGHAKGKRKGEKGGLAWVGDEGSKSNPKPELIQTRSGAYLAGTQGWEQVYLDDGDIVYSASDTKKLLAGDKRLTDRFIRRRAAGTPKFLSSDSDSDSVKKAIDAWSNQVSSWEHNVDIGRATQSQYVNWLKSQYKISNKMTEDQYRSAEKTIWDYYEAFEEAALDNYLTSLKYGKLTLDQTLNYIRQSRKAQKITQEKADELEYEAYKNHIEWNIKKFENDEATFADTKKLVLDFYNYQKKYGKMSLDDYYDYLDDLADAAQEKELDRLEKLQEREENQQDLAKKYAQLQVDNIEKQIDAIDKQNEAQDKANELAELYNDLAEARSKRVRIYREGVGFVYEQDTKAIKEAQKAISDFEAENAADSLEGLKKQWQDILDMFDDQDALADIKELEKALGMTSKELFGDMGTNLKQWTEWYKNTVSTGMGLEDIITQLDALSGWDKITNYLNAEGKVDWNKIKQAIQNNRFASGTTNAKGGFSVVGEKGWELGLLNKGDAIFPHDISKNLMEWGKYSPNQYKFKDTNTGRVETYNFDKLVLPNVFNANEFVNELKKLPNLAIQRSGRR